MLLGGVSKSCGRDCGEPKNEEVIVVDSWFLDRFLGNVDGWSVYGIVGVSALVIDRNDDTKIELLRSARC